MGGTQTKGTSTVEWLCQLDTSHLPLSGVSPSRLHFQRFRRDRLSLFDSDFHPLARVAILLRQAAGLTSYAEVVVLAKADLC